MAKRLDDHHFLITLKVWKEEVGDGKFRLHLVSADPDIPNNGVHITMRPQTMTFSNTAQMIENLNQGAEDQ